jgi:folliculin-interacting protein 2
MVFGSVAISFRGPSFKIHWLDSPTRVLCSQVFLAPVQPYSSTSSSSANTHSSFNQTHASSNYGSDLISDISGSVSETNSLNSFSVSDSAHNVSLRTHPLDVPTALSLDNDDFKFISQSIGDGSSGYISSEPFQQRYSSARSSLASIYSEVENSSRRMSFDSTHELGCEFGRFNRRIMKNLSTSFENVSTITDNLANIIENNYFTVTGASNLTGLSDGCVSKLRRNSEVVDRRKTTSGDALSSNSSTLHHHRPKRPRLAISVCITMSECMEQEMICFCSEHMALIEVMLYRLRAAAENAYINRQNFLPVSTAHQFRHQSSNQVSGHPQLMIKAFHSSSQWMVDLFSAPRLASPIWLTLSTETKHSTVLASSFLQDLMTLLNTADTKDTNL